jgi:hypothetical protein
MTLVATAFREHPYHHPTIGWRADVEGVSTERLRELYDTFYHPDNATVFVVGRLSTKRERALRSNEPSVSCRARTRPIPEVYTEEPPQAGERSVVVKRPGDTTLVALAFHTPGRVRSNARPAERGATRDRGGRRLRTTIPTRSRCWRASSGTGARAGSRARSSIRGSRSTRRRPIGARATRASFKSRRRCGRALSPAACAAKSNGCWRRSRRTVPMRAKSSAPAARSPSRAHSRATARCRSLSGWRSSNGRQLAPRRKLSRARRGPLAGARSRRRASVSARRQPHARRARAGNAEDVRSRAVRSRGGEAAGRSASEIAPLPQPRSIERSRFADRVAGASLANGVIWRYVESPHNPTIHVRGIVRGGPGAYARSPAACDDRRSDAGARNAYARSPGDRGTLGAGRYQTHVLRRRRALAQL